MFPKAFYALLAIISLSFSAIAQNCTLDIGGKNIDLIVTVFQLNEAQVSTMEQLRAELEIKAKSVEADIQKLFEQHPQSTPEELTTLAGKYKVLQQELVAASFSSDKKLLATFNEKQYQRYFSLCNEALRDPIRVIPIQIGDSIDPK